jgi:hypothetical protein
MVTTQPASDLFSSPLTNASKRTPGTTPRTQAWEHEDRVDGWVIGLWPRGRTRGGPRGRTFFRYLSDSRLGLPRGVSAAARRSSCASERLGLGRLCTRGWAGLTPTTTLLRFRLASAGSSQGTPRGTAYFGYLSDSRTSCPVGFRQWRVASRTFGGRGAGPPDSGGTGGAQAKTARPQPGTPS